MKFLVTGATGFIGSHFVNLAISEGHNVLALRRTKNSLPRIPLLEQPEWFTGDMEAVKPRDLAGVDTLVHLAAHGVNSLHEPIEKCIRANLLQPLRLFQQAKAAGIRRFLVAGSCFEYGRSAERYERTPPDAPLEPVNPYASSKAAASHAFLSFAMQERISLEIQRIFHVYGDGENATRLWPSLRSAALSGHDFEMTAGEQVRDFIPVKDVAKAILSASCEHNVPIARVTNLATGKPQTIKDFAEFWWKHWNARGRLSFARLPYRENELMRCVGQPGSIVLSP
jgi:nucleoside-diphosphate-sugar epimerase